MPKKTRKQKLLAKLHRKFDNNPSFSNYVKSQNIIQSKIMPSFTYRENLLNKNSVTKAQNTELALYYSYLKKDLIKITIFTLAAIILQVVLYFFLHRV